MKPRGFVLIEMMAALVLFSLAGTGLYTAIAQGMRAHKLIRETAEMQDPVKMAWLKWGKDLRNTVSLRDFPFRGRHDAMEFPVLTTDRLLRVQYVFEEGNLIRREKALPEEWIERKSSQKVLIKEADDVTFEYAYLDEEDELAFRPVWPEEPYYGIPRAVRITVKLKRREEVFSRLVSVPQGRWGRWTEGEETHE